MNGAVKINIRQALEEVFGRMSDEDYAYCDFVSIVQSLREPKLSLLKVAIQKQYDAQKLRPDYTLTVVPAALRYEEGFEVQMKIGVQTFSFLVRETEADAMWYKEQIQAALDSLTVSNTPID